MEPDISLPCSEQPATVPILSHINPINLFIFQQFYVLVLVRKNAVPLTIRHLKGTYFESTAFNFYYGINLNHFTNS
jgi:hypothetical protein